MDTSERIFFVGIAFTIVGLLGWLIAEGEWVAAAAILAASIIINTLLGYIANRSMRRLRNHR